MGVEITEDAQTIQAHPFSGPTAFMLGNEVRTWAINSNAIAICVAFKQDKNRAAANQLLLMSKSTLVGNLFTSAPVTSHQCGAAACHKTSLLHAGQRSVPAAGAAMRRICVHTPVWRRNSFAECHSGGINCAAALCCLGRLPGAAPNRREI